MFWKDAFIPTKSSTGWMIKTGLVIAGMSRQHCTCIWLLRLNAWCNYKHQKGPPLQFQCVCVCVWKLYTQRDGAVGLHLDGLPPTCLCLLYNEIRKTQNILNAHSSIHLFLQDAPQLLRRQSVVSQEERGMVITGQICTISNMFTEHLLFSER